MCQHNRLTAPPLSLFLLQTSSNRIEASLRNVFRIHFCAFVILTQIFYLSCRSVSPIVCPFQIWSFDGSCGFKAASKRLCFHVSIMELKPNFWSYYWIVYMYLFVLNECTAFVFSCPNIPVFLFLATLVPVNSLNIQLHAEKSIFSKAHGLTSANIDGKQTNQSSSVDGYMELAPRPHLLSLKSGAECTALR